MSLSGGLKALTSSNAKQAAPPTQAPELQQANSEERPQATALQRSPSKEARPRDELSGKLMLEVVDGTKLPLSAKSNPYILCNFDADFSSTGSPVSSNSSLNAVSFKALTPRSLLSHPMRLALLLVRSSQVFIRHY